MKKPCECCWIAMVERSVTNPSHYCGPCHAHLHNIDTMRADHCKIIADVRNQHEKAIAKARQSQESRAQSAEDFRRERDELVRAIATNFSDAPSAELTQLMERAVSVDLQERVRVSYKTRDRAMAAVGQFFDIHDETLSGKCKCGKPLNACRDYKSLAFFRESFERWESHQIALMKSGKSHGLPADHPESRKVYRDRWSWKGAPPIRSDDHSRRTA